MDMENLVNKSDKKFYSSDASIYTNTSSRCVCIRPDLFCLVRSFCSNVRSTKKMSEFSHLIYKVYYNYWFSHQKATKLEKVDVTLTLTTSDFKSSDIVNYTFENFNCIQDPEKGIEEYIKKDIGTYEKSNVKKIVIPKKLIDLVRSEIIKDPNISEYVIKLPKDVAFNTHPLVYFYALKEAVKSIKTEYENRKKLETEVGLIELNIDKTIKVAIDSSASSTQKDYIILEDCKAEEFLHKGFDALKELYTILYSEKQ